MINYCVQDTAGYFCDWNSQHYTSYAQCFNECGIYAGDTLLHVSKVDLTLILLAFSFFFALFILKFFIEAWND